MAHRNGESRVILKLFLIIGVLGLTMSFFREDKKDHSEGRYSRAGDPIVPAKSVSSSNFPLFPWSEETNTRDKDTNRNKDKDTNETQDENKEKGKDKDPEKEYPFDHTEGIIGRMDESPDDAYDNLFHVQLPFLSAEVEGRLEYEVQGSPGTEIYLSLNHEASQKETLTRKGWQKKTRYLTPSELRTPDNVLLFSAPEGTTYRIKNPKIYLSSGASPRVSQSEAVLLEGFSSYTPDPVNSTRIDYHGARLELPAGSQKISQKLYVLSLREVDLPPLEPSLVNVTRNCRGYRFLPHGAHFEKQLHLSLAYDSLQLPSGYSPQDIKIYYFDETTRRWNSLPTDSVDSKSGRIVSLTDHFTDFIAGVLKTPESPETAGYTPTQMSDIKAADPTTKVQLISPPGVNNRGSANLSYSFEIPSARNGMSPSLGIQYSSDGGSGLLGEGWDLNIPGITVDTRWGVPRYDLSKETETYLLDGTQLMTRDSQGNNYLAHRGEKIPRESDRLFFLRKEGSFSNIQRKGNSPENYVWEVTDRRGTKYTYGSNTGKLKGTYIGVNGQVREVISQWRLSRVEEPHGDWIEYIYEQEEEPIRGSLTSRALYLKEIQAGNKGEPAHTTVKLKRDKYKQKQTSNAGYGYLNSSNRLLTQIEVYFKSEKLREYEFQYKSGTFHTDLLDKIVQKDGKGEEFNSHRFEYYDDVQASGGYFKGGESWNTHKDGISGGLINPVSKVQTTGEFSDKATALGGSKSTNISGSIYAGIGPPGSVLSKSNTGGFSFSYSYSEGQGLSTFADINGDGIPDKIYKSGGSLHYRGGSRSGAFGPSIKIENLEDFSTTYSNSTSYGSKFFFGVQLGVDVQMTKTKISRYFTDVNADGLMDMVVGGSTVYFNHIEKDSQGNPVPTFTTSSGDTPSPINGGGIIDDSDTAVDPEEQKKLIEDHPLQDAVRIWIAPRDGKVNITGNAALQQPQSGAKPAQDGVKLTIQHNTTDSLTIIPTLLKNHQVGATDYSAKDMNHNGLEVKAGDRLYFRVQSGTEEDSNGENDRVHWLPQVSYTTKAPEDPNGYSQNYPSSSAIVSDEGIITVPVKDSYTIKGKFTKPVTTDSLTLKILLGTDVAYEQTYSDQQTHNGEFTLPLTNDKQADQIQFILESSSTIAWDKIRWEPLVYYKDTLDNDIMENSLPGSVKYKGIYPQVFQDSESQTVKNAGEAELTTEITFKPDTTQEQKEAVEGVYTLTVKKQTGIIYKGLVEIKKGKITQGDVFHNVPLPSGELWVELFSDDPNIKLDSVESIKTRITDTFNIKTRSISGVYHTTGEQRFGPLHRGWGQFSYNSMEGRALLPIQEQLLKFPKEESESDPRTMVFLPMSLDIETRSHWRGGDSQVYISGAIMSSSRLGQKDVKLDNPLSGLSSGTASPSGSCITGGGAVGVRQESKSTSTAAMGGYGAFDLSASVSNSKGEDEQLLSFGDMNGDGYPDIISRNQIQYTNTRGGFDGEILSHSGYHSSSSKSLSAGTGGNPVHAASLISKTVKLNNAKAQKAQAEKGVKAAEGADEKTKAEAAAIFKEAETAADQAKTALENAKSSKKVSISVSFDYNKSSDEAVSTYMDINGDGLPDKITGGKQVRLNLGYGFAPPVDWELSRVQEGSSRSMSPGVSLGYDKTASSWSGGTGVALTTSQADFTMTDINSDGLVDKLRISDEDVYVSLNKGNSFAEEQLWGAVGPVQKSSSVGESLNGAATFGFNIPVVPPFRIVINPGANVGHSMSRTLSDLRDVDGDGYPDALYSDKEQELQVKRSTIGRTNKLKTVKNPLGGSFTLDYIRTEATYEHPGGKWVLSSVDTDDGVHDDGANARMEYTYIRGKHDRHEREFLGFEQVETRSVHNAQTYRRTLQKYDTDSYYTSGNLLYSRMEDTQGNPYTETLNKYYVYEVKQTGEGKYTLSPTDLCSDRQSSYTPMKYTQSKIYEGKPEGIVSGESWYSYDTTDQYGEVLQYKYSDTGTLGENGSGGYTYQTQIAYTSNASKYIFGLPSSVTVTGSDGKIYRQVSADYDPDYSDLIRVRQKLNEQGEEAVTDITYDQNGNILQKTLPKNHKGERMWYKYTYDPEIHTYPVKIEDAFGYSSSAVYNYGLGAPLETTDMNGEKILYTYDSQGRTSSITAPLELASGKPYTLKFEYHPKAVVNAQGEITQPSYAVTKHYDPQHPGDDIETVSFVDGAGRALQVKKEGIVTTTDGGEPQDTEVWIVSGRSKYDPWGRVTESYYPLTENKSQKLIFNKNFDTTAPTRMQYDLLDRVTKTTLPDGSISTVSYNLDTSARILETTTTDALGGKQKTYSNLRGLTEKTEQLSGPDGIITTRFQYDQINRLLEVTDTKGLKTTSVYDIGGRRTQVEHPDAGTTRYKYDPAGNLTERITAQIAKDIPNGGAIKYNYDYNRLASIAYPKNYQNNVSYAYGKPGDKNHRAGRLYLVTDASGGRELFYGRLGELTKEIRTIRISSSNIRTYVSNYEYDSWGRITQMIYPDGEKVHYRYNSAGNLYSVFGEKLGREYPYIDRLGYDKFEQRVYLKYGNGTQTTYNYEPQRRRLSHLKVEKETQSILNNTYSYDLVSNVTKITGKQGFHNYQYDELYRLKEAKGEYTDPAKGENGFSSYWLKMQYDNLHNITSKKLGHTVFGSYPKQSNYELEYQYSQERPHQLSQIKELTVTAGEEKTHKYNYDPNGNMVHRQEDIHYRSLIWDEENRLMGVNDEGYASRYVYDDTGERVLKSSGGVTQVSVNGTSMGTMEDMKNYTGYLSPYFVFKEGSFTKHIYAGTERIVSQIGNGEFNNNSGGLGGNGITAGGLNFAQVQDWYEVQKEKYIASLGVPPGPPDKKGIYASPQYTGKPWPDFGSPLNSSLNTPPKGWPKMPVFNPPGGPPGPPVQFGPAQTNDSVNGGYGYSGTGTFAEDRYFYHHDHLGSSSYLTNQLGNITQHVEYIPFGEVFVEERNEKWNTPYLFNGKELDEETGLYYYGARYYDSKISLWLSVDPLAEQFPSWSPYSYGFNNPLRFTDPTGMAPEDFIKNKTTGEIEWRADVTSKATTPEGYDYVGSTYNGLSISKYDAHTTRGIGIEIQAGYNDGKEGDLDVRWVQTIRTNNPLGGATSPYNDPQPPDDAKPFYWTDAELPDYKNKGGQDLIFYDRPTRSASKDGVTWEGELSAVINSGDGYKPVVTIRYGFETKGGVAVPSKVIVNTPSDFQNKTIEDYNKTLSKP